VANGLGASVKRSADNAIKHGKASIQIEPEKVLNVLSEPPAKIGSRERSMKIVDTDFENIENYFQRYKQA
jgi:lipoate-protein ligase A